MARPVRIAVIIPTLDEAAHIAGTLAPIVRQPGVIPIVADGGSRDNTRAIAERAGATVLMITGGRAAQMNAGAAATDAEHLVFLHADTQLPPDWAMQVRRLLADRKIALGAFRLAIAGAGWPERLIAAGANLRSRVWGVPYGDQALFLRSDTFRRLGGFPPLPIMEDWALARSARRLGRIAIASSFVTTSARRWRTLGPWRTFAINQAMLVGARLGVPYERLASFYRRPPRPPSIAGFQPAAPEADCAPNKSGET